MLAALVVHPLAAVQAGGHLPAGFVYLRAIDPTIRQEIRYAGPDNFTGAPVPGYAAAECLLIEPAARSLARVQAELAAFGLGLMVYDCYRPARAVAHFRAWAEDHAGTGASHRFHPGVTDRRRLLDGFIARRSRHSLGVAVDLTLVSLNAAPAPAFDPNAVYGPCDGPMAARSPDNGLDMGTGFDCFADASQADSGAVSAEVKERRRFLHRVMARYGWRNYAREWWHFEFRDRSQAPGAPLDVPVSAMP